MIERECGSGKGHLDIFALVGWGGGVGLDVRVEFFLFALPE
jgi:hypothetical protein